MNRNLLHLAPITVILLSTLSAFGNPIDAIAKTVKADKSSVAIMKAAEEENEETWNQIGKATWVEGPSDQYASSISGKSWVIDIEESESTPGRYRMIPYGKGSALSDLLWFDCDEYFYVNTQDPEKVYCEDYSHIFFDISQLVPENGWQDVAIYGTIKDHVVSFPAKSFGLNENGSWVYSNNNGNFKIFLPGADVKDYSFSAEVTSCADDEMITISTVSGNDIASVKYVVVEGSKTFNDSDFEEVASSGSEIAANGETKWTSDKAGKYTIAIVAIDAENNIQGSDYFVAFIHDDDKENWESIGSASFTDPVLSALGYEDELLNEPQTYDVEVERSINNPAMIRIVDPYVNHPFFIKHTEYLTPHSHHHYIYLDMADPDYIVVSESPTGIDLGYGQVCVNSPAFRYGAEHSKEDIKKYYGCVTIKDGEITFASQSLFASETLEDHNALYRTDTIGKLFVPALSGIESIESEDSADTTYYNLQGFEITNPANGELVIKKTGKHITKVIFR